MKNSVMKTLPAAIMLMLIPASTSRSNAQQDLITPHTTGEAACEPDSGDFKSGQWRIDMQDRRYPAIVEAKAVRVDNQKDPTKNSIQIDIDLSKYGYLVGQPATRLANISTNEIGIALNAAQAGCLKRAVPKHPVTERKYNILWMPRR